MLNSTRAAGLTFLFPEGDTVVGPSLQRFGEFARPEVDFLVEAARGPSGVFLDVGANIGAIALPFALHRPGWAVTAVEAHRGLCAVLSANAFGNHLYNVQTVNAAAGPGRAIVEFPMHPLDNVLNFGDSGFHQTARRAALLQLPVDELAPDASIIKVDVQGFEAEVLKGAGRTLAARQAIWFLEVPTDVQARGEMAAALLSADYTLYWFFSPFGTRVSPRGKVAAGTLEGDANFVAVPAGRDPPWPLTLVRDPQEPRPGVASAYPYLARYGY